MNTKHLLRCISVLVLTPILAHGAAYIKFDGIDGESKDKDHKGWIDLDSMSVRSGDHDDWIVIESFSQVIHRDIAARNVQSRRDVSSGQATGRRDRVSGQSTDRRDAASGMATGKRQHKPIKITKRVDKATPMLANSLSNGSSIGDVTITRVENGKTETIVLVNAVVAAIQKNGPREEVTFNYERIRQTSKASVRGWDAKNKQAIQGKAKEKANKTK